MDKEEVRRILNNVRSAIIMKMPRPVDAPPEGGLSYHMGEHDKKKCWLCAVEDPIDKAIEELVRFP